MCPPLLCQRRQLIGRMSRDPCPTRPSMPRSVSDSENLRLLWLVILKSVWYNVRSHLTAGELAVSCFCDLSKIKHTFFSFLHAPLVYTMIAKLCMRFAVTDLRFVQNLCFIDFHIFGSSFPWKYRLPQKTHSTKLQFFSKNWWNFHIDQSKWRLVKRQMKFPLRYGPEKNCIEPP